MTVTMQAPRGAELKLIGRAADIWLRQRGWRLRHAAFEERDMVLVVSPTTGTEAQRAVLRTLRVAARAVRLQGAERAIAAALRTQ